MVLATLESSPTSAKYSMNLCGRFESIGGIEKLPVAVYLIQVNEQPFDKISTTSSFELSTQNQC